MCVCVACNGQFTLTRETEAIIDSSIFMHTYIYILNLKMCLPVIHLVLGETNKTAPQGKPHKQLSAFLE